MLSSDARIACSTEAVAVVFGTRPEAIKLTPVIEGLGTPVHLIHSGQHFSPEMTKFIHRDLRLPDLHAQFDIGGQSRAEQIGNSVLLLSEHLKGLPACACLVVQGDTNTALGAAIAANAIGLPLVHVEAGLRSYDRAMPEEHNRVVVDHLADILCSPTVTAKENLVREGINPDHIIVTGNTVVDSILLLAPNASKRSEILRSHGLVPADFVLATFHRPENVDNPEQLQSILTALNQIPRKVVIPLHPRTLARISRFGMESLISNMHVIPPLGYVEFLGLMSEASLIVSDSGGIQEEASVVKRPVVLVRHSTERPEVLGTFVSLVTDLDELSAVINQILGDVSGTHAYLSTLPCPYGDGQAGLRTSRAIEQLLGIPTTTPPASR